MHSDFYCSDSIPSTDESKDCEIIFTKSFFLIQTIAETSFQPLWGAVSKVALSKDGA